MKSNWRRGPGIGRRGIAEIDGARFRSVALEMRRVDQNLAHDSGKSEADDAPVVAGLPAAARLPAVHPLAPVRVLALAPDRLSRLDEVVLRGEELVVGLDDRSAQAFRSEIDELRENGQGVSSRWSLSRRE